LLTRTINKHAPLIKLFRKQKHLKSRPWITKGIFISIKNKQKLHKTHYTHGLPAEKKHYKLYSNTLTRMKNRAKQLSYHHKIDEYKHNPKKTWDLLRSLFPSKSNSTLPSSLSINNSSVTNLNAIVQEFNCHFSTIG